MCVYFSISIVVIKRGYLALVSGHNEVKDTILDFSTLMP